MKISNKKLLATAIASTLGAGMMAVATAEQTLTRPTGAPVGDNQNSQTAGPWGPTVLQDHHLLEKLAHFDRERIPERVVHARGTGAHGTFTASESLADYTIAAPFQSAGQETEVFVRFSTVVHPLGSPETLRDPRGFAVKFYTEQGNWDLVGNNLPVFFIRDAIKFPDMVHSFKPDPITNIQDAARVFDFLSHIPESTKMLTYLYSPLGIPRSYREMDGNGVHAYKLTNESCDVHYVKFNWRSNQGVEGLTPEQASEIQATNFNHATEDLYAEIDAGNYPSWDLYIQTITPDQLNSFDFNPLDPTKEWPESEAPARKVGTLELNRVPDNFFQSTEQVAVAPSNLIPGIEASEDRLLQGRLFSYADTQRYRLGINHNYLPINAAKNAEVVTYARDGAGYSPARSGSVNYQPSRYVEVNEDPRYRACEVPVSGTIQQRTIEKTQNFAQAGELYRSFSPEYQDSLIEALAGDLGGVESSEVREVMTAHFYKADQEYGTRLAEKVNVDLRRVRQIADQLED